MPSTPVLRVLFLTLAVTSAGWTAAPDGVPRDESTPRETPSIASLDGRTSTDAASLEALVDAYLPGAMADADVPGLALAIVQGGRLLLAKGYGFAELDGNRVVDPATTVFRLGSIAKPLTATIVLATSMEAGVGLDEDVRGFFDDLDLRQREDLPITLRQLLTHTAGYNENLFGQHCTSPSEVLPLAEFLRGRLPPPFARPGEVIAYSDFNTSLAGLVAERLSDEAFPALAEKLLFEPLGMERSTFRQVDLAPSIEAGLAKSYRRVDGRLVAYPRDFVQTTPAAGLQASAMDMAKYLGELLDGLAGRPTRILGAEGWREQIEVHYRYHPRLHGKALGLTEVPHGGRTLLYKDGQASGFHARLVIVPQADAAFFAVHNRGIIEPMGRFNSASRLNRELGWKIVDELAPPLELEPLPLHEPRLVSAEGLKRYAGVYRTTVASRHTAEKLISLMDEVVVRPDGERLLVGGAPFVEGEPGLFQSVEDRRTFVAFDPQEGAEAPYLYIGAGAYERIPWYESSAATVRMVAAFASIFLLGAAFFGWRSLALARRSPDATAARRFAISATLVALLDLLFLLAFGSVLAFTDVQFLFHGWPTSARLALALPLLGIPLLLVLSLQLFGRPTSSGLGRIDRSMATALCLAAFAFLAWLHVWNLLGWRL